MTAQAGPSAHGQGTQISSVTRITGQPMTPFQTTVAVVCLLLVLWIAYRIGKVILRLVAGLLFIGLLGFGIWYLFIK